MRRLFTALSAISLAMCVVVAVLRARSRPVDELVWMSYKRWTGADDLKLYFIVGSSYAGTLRVRVDRTHFAPRYFQVVTADWAKLMRQKHHPPGLDFGGADRFRTAAEMSPGFHAAHYTTNLNPGHRGDEWVVAAPAWAVMTLLLVLPALWMNRWRGSRRVKRMGLCPSCGYDLRASSDRCPECGAAISPAAAV